MSDIEKFFMDKSTFSKIIEEKVKRGMSHFEAVLQFCDEADKDPAEVKKYMQPVLLQKIKQSAIKDGLITIKDEPEAL